VLERAEREVLADRPERVHVDVVWMAPVLELDTEFDRGLAAAHEVALVERQRLVKRQDGRNRRLADSDRADVIRLPA
jgi:hypothetical protein